MDDYLSSVSLINCTGTISHTLTLLVDGTVRVRLGNLDVVVDPSTRTHRPATIQLGRGQYDHDQVINLACGLARG